MKSHARVVVIGGGALGVAALYHLVKEGWSDVVLVEKGELTSGSTWHAAGLVPHFIGSLNMGKIHQYGASLYASLEAETGQATGWHGCGSLRLATNQDEVDWFHSVKGVLDQIGSECHLLSPSETLKVNPLLNLDGVLLSIYTPNDGHTDPNGSTNAMAIGARNGGAQIYKHTRVLNTTQLPNGEWEIETDKGNITCEHLVNAAGSYARQLGEWVGMNVPIINMVHQYLVTDNIDEVAALDKELPVTRDPRTSCYYRQEQKGLIIGPYETSKAEAWSLDGVSWDFDMELLTPDLDRLEPHLERTMECLPAFAKGGIKRIVSGPITHTPDGGFLLGPAPGLRNYWMCCGASIGITQGPGAGKYLAQWMVHGQTEINVRELDPRRYSNLLSRGQMVDKCIDEYHHMYAIHYPGEYREPGRPVFKTPLYETLKQKGADYADTYGWERPKWFDLKNEGEQYSFRRNNTFDAIAAECKTVAESVGIADLSAFAKYDVTGKDAEAFLNRLCANNMPTRQGGIVLAHCLTELGGIESELSVTRMADDHFFVLSAIAAQQHDLDWLQQHIAAGEDLSVKDITQSWGMIGIMGPKSRDTISKITDADVSNKGFRWLTSQEISVAGKPVRALRVSYVGELGWELHTPMKHLQAVYDALIDAGAEFGMSHFGTMAMNSMRMEKAFKAWGAELTTEITPVEADIMRFVKMDSDFIGKQSVADRQNAEIALQCVYLEVNAKDADCLGNEPVMHKDEIVGVITSGAYGHRTGKSLAFAYVRPEFAQAGGTLTVSVLGEVLSANVLTEPAYDANASRMRA
ncbi:MAG: FAD-dependent oxidoreductase [Arenicellales bacterium WSBS_2016_MAG_OTU3]